MKLILGELDEIARYIVLSALKIAGALIFFSLIFLIIWVFTGPSRDETFTYKAYCENGIKIVPIPYEVNINDVKKFYDNKKLWSECRISTGIDKSYKINSARAEVYYESFGVPVKLVDCVIIDNKNWRCAFPDGSGYINVRNGLEGIPENDDYHLYFSLHRYQYWYVTIYSLIFGESPTGAWLIPLQQESPQ